MFQTQQSPKQNVLSASGVLTLFLLLFLLMLICLVYWVYYAPLNISAHLQLVVLNLDNKLLRKDTTFLKCYLKHCVHMAF